MIEKRTDWQERLSPRVNAIAPSGIRKFFDIAAQMEDVISLGVGEPDFVTPWSIRESCVYGLEQGYTSYTANRGLPELREEIAKHYQRISDRDAYVTAEMVLAQSSVWIYSIPQKHIVTTAHYNGKIPRNPFAQYHVDPDFKEREYLTEKELRAFATVETPFLTGTSCCVAPVSARNLRGNMDYILQTARITSSVSG